VQGYILGEFVAETVAASPAKPPGNERAFVRPGRACSDRGARLGVHGAPVVNIRWSNIPIPEPFVVGLTAGALLHLVVPTPILPTSGIPQLAGPVLFVTGVAIAAWSVVAVRDNDLARPSAVNTRGPYALSRNPMYLGWIALCTGLALIVNSVWMAIATAGAWISSHRDYSQRRGVPAEEVRRAVRSVPEAGPTLLVNPACRRRASRVGDTDR